MLLRAALATSLLAVACARIETPVQVAPAAAPAHHGFTPSPPFAWEGPTPAGSLRASSRDLDGATIEALVQADAAGLERAGGAAQKTLLRGLALVDRAGGGVFDAGEVTPSGRWRATTRRKGLRAQAAALDAYRAGYAAYGTGAFGAAGRAIAAFVAGELLQADGTFAAAVTCEGGTCTREGTAAPADAARMVAALARWAAVAEPAHIAGAPESRAAAIAAGRALRELPAAAPGADAAYAALSRLDPTWSDAVANAAR